MLLRKLKSMIAWRKYSLVPLFAAVVFFALLEWTTSDILKCSLGSISRLGPQMRAGVPLADIETEINFRVTFLNHPVHFETVTVRIDEEREYVRKKLSIIEIIHWSRRIVCIAFAICVYLFLNGWRKQYLRRKQEEAVEA
jgi:hypothetical protein